MQLREGTSHKVSSFSLFSRQPLPRFPIHIFEALAIRDVTSPRFPYTRSNALTIRPRIPNAPPRPSRRLSGPLAPIAHHQSIVNSINSRLGYPERCVASRQSICRCTCINCASFPVADSKAAPDAPNGPISDLRRMQPMHSVQNQRRMRMYPSHRARKQCAREAL